MVAPLRSGAQDAISPLQDVADDAISPGHRLLRQPGPRQRARGRERAPAAPERRPQEPDRGEPVGGRRRLGARGSSPTCRTSPTTTPCSPASSTVPPATSSARSRSTGGATTGSRRTWRSSSARTGRARRQSHVGLEARATVQRIDDPQFGVGVQLLDPSGTLGPTGLRCRAEGQQLPRSPARPRSSQKLVKGEFAITRGLDESPFPRGLAVGTVVHNVDPSTATAEPRCCDRSSTSTRSTIVKVLRYQPVAVP